MKYNWQTELGIVLIFFTIFLAIVCNGCGNCPPIERETKYEIVHDTVKVSIPSDVQFDTVYVNNGSGESERYIVRIDTVKVLIKGKERIIYVPRIDTVTQTIYREVQRDFFDTIYDWISLKKLAILLLCVVFVSFVGWILRLFGVFR